MPLTSLEISDTKVFDLSPLKGMPLTTLSCGNNAIADLAPLKGMSLTSLNILQSRKSPTWPRSRTCR